MEKTPPKKTFEEKALRYVADIMKSSRQYREEQTQGEQVQNEQTQEGQAQKKLTQYEVTALRDLNIFFREANLAGTDTEKKREIVKKVFNVYRKNRNNKEITLVCLFVLTNILESIDLNRGKEDKDIIIEVIYMLRAVYYPGNSFLYEDNPECINDFSMYMIPRINAMLLKNGIQFDDTELEKYIETMRNIYLINPKKEYSKAINTCIEMLSRIIGYCENQTIQKDVLKEIYVIYDIAIENKNNVVVVKCLQKLSDIIIGSDSESKIPEEVSKKMYTICDNAFEKGNYIVIGACLQPLSVIATRIYSDLETRKRAIGEIRIIYDIAIENKNNVVAVKCLQTLSKIATKNPLHPGVREQALEKLHYVNSKMEMILKNICTVYNDTPKKENNEVIKECLQPLSVIVECCDNETKQREALEQIYIICDIALEKKDVIVVDKCSQVLQEIATHCSNEKIQKEASKKIGAISSRGFGGNTENSQNVLTRIFARLSRANGSMPAISSQSRFNN